MDAEHEVNGLLERPFFFDLGRDRLFAVLHRPRAGSATHGLVFCHALAEEKLWSHRVFVSLARELARRGMAVLRFDFRGEGDSDLEFEQTGICSRVDDAVRAAEVLLEQEPRLQGVTFLGHRLGGAIAAAAAQRLRSRARALIVWNPVPGGREYLMGLLRANLASQIAVDGKVTRARDALLRSLDAGETVLVDGCEISPSLYRELIALDWPGMLERLDCPALVVEQETSPAKEPAQVGSPAGQQPVRVHRARACEPAFWSESKRFFLSAPNMTRVSVQWLEQQAT